ncbi:DUF2339 domain-containing protein [Saccharopolyspora sp. MS10]|uniref:DUF2339 domain-containing protein n=1 Tax=Saccharopolyspora sp. MS10 TaxID=3385973 RepID=UPI0039A0DCE1
MATQRTARTIAGPGTDLGDLADPIDRIAAMFTDLGTELGVLGEQLRGQHAKRASTAGESTTKTEGDTVITGERVPTGGRSAAPPGRPAPPGPEPGGRPEAVVRTGPAPLPGEPVDTSFAEPTQTPAARAAGAAPRPGPGSEGTAPRFPEPRAPQAPAAWTPPTSWAPPPAPGFATWLNQPVGGGPAQEPERAPLADRVADWTSRQGTRLLAWAGAAITLLGVVLLMVLAVQHGWIGPGGRIAGGAVLGAGLIGSAFQVRRRAAIPGAFALAATGIAVLYLDVLAATALYDFLPATAGLAAALVLALLGLLLADRWRSQALAVGVVLGCALSAPLLFGPVPAAPASSALLTGFLVVLKIAAAPVQVRRSWRGLTAASAAPAILAALLSDGHAWLAGEPLAATGAALAVAASGFALSLVLAHRRPRDPMAIALLLTSSAPALLIAPALDRGSALGVLALLAALHGAAWWAGRTGRASAALGAAGGGMAALVAFQATLLVAGGSGRSLGLLAEATVLALLARRLRGRGLLLSAALFGSSGVVLALISEIPPGVLLTFPVEPYLSGGTPALVSGLAAFLLIGSATATSTWAAVVLEVLPRTPQALLPAAAGVLYGGAGLVLTAALLVSPSPAGFLAGHAAITVCWLVLAFLALLRGIRSVPLRAAGFALVGVALAKLLLFDLAALSGLVRVLVFLAAGLILLAGGTRYARLLAERGEG